MSKGKMANIFVEGPINSLFIAEKIQQHQAKTAIGAHSIFLGQVRADYINEQQIQSIEYTSYESMALVKMGEIREAIFAQFDLTCLHVYHSLGEVKAGEICLFVFASSKHRKIAIDGCTETVEKIKKELPVWGKEIFVGGNYQWKQNT